MFVEYMNAGFTVLFVSVIVIWIFRALVLLLINRELDRVEEKSYQMLTFTGITQGLMILISGIALTISIFIAFVYLIGMLTVEAGLI